MSLSIVSGWMFVEKRRLVQVFPEPVRRIWNEWELRVMVLLSLTLQIFLILNGNRRKYIATRRIRIFIWSAYLMADWVATVALGVLFNHQGNSCSSGTTTTNNPGDGELNAFWAPFLLLHLGGPDTITAYALADNELWIRHLLGLIVQSGVALLISLLAWQSTWLSFLTIPMLLAGIIKYGERSWALMSANREQFRDSVLTPRDPGPSYAKFMEEFSFKEAEGYHVTADEVIEVNVPADDFDVVKVANISIPDASILQNAHNFFKTFKRLFVDLILSFHERDVSQSFFQKTSCKTAFKVIEVELGFAYDVFYTKAPINYTPWGFFSRFITSSFTFLVFVAFLITIGVNVQKHTLIDLVITYILLGGAIILEVTAVISLLSSDWTNLWLSGHSKTPFFGAISRLQFHQRHKFRWSKSMNQYNLLSFCLHQKTVISPGIRKLVPLHKKLQILLEKLSEKLGNVQQLRIRTPISDDLEASIFKHFLEKSKSTDLAYLCTCRGRLALEKYGAHCHDQLSWTTRVEFDHSILIWHIATSLCYSVDDGEEYQKTSSSCKASKELADYMLYLLVKCPFMLPIGIGMIIFRDTCAEAMDFFQDKSPISYEEACKMLTQVSTKLLPIKVKGDRSKSVLFDACRLANSLQKMGDKEKWEMVSDVWVEMLGYAASHCRGYFHAQQLQKGGELLTHVWLLMAHLGITEQLQISQGHARAKLTVK